MIDIESGVIEFDLDHDVMIARDGEQVPVRDIKFKQPSRKTAAIFENLVSMFSTATQDIFTVLDKFDPEGAEDQKRKAKSKASEKTESAEKELQGITLESVMEEARSHMDFVNNLSFDFEKAYKLFDKMLLQEARFCVCWIGGLPIKDGHLDNIDYRDLKLMMFVYISFFGKPAKSATGKDSKQRSDSPMPAKEL